MPTTTPPSDRLTPKSALHHRPIGTADLLEEPPRVARASRDTLSSQTQAHQSMQQRAAVARTTAAPSRDVPVVSVWRQCGAVSASRPLHASRSLVLPIGVGMLLALLAVLVGQLLIGWVGNLWNDLHYGFPRMYQVDVVVGHHDSIAHPSHFLALNLKGQIEVIEFPGGDVSQAKVYLVARLVGPQAALVPVTLRFVPDAQTHQSEMVVLFGGEQVTYHTAQGNFQALSTEAALCPWEA